MTQNKKKCLFFAFCIFITFHGWGDSCVASNCHENFKKIKHIHAPAEDDCTACHKKVGNHYFELQIGKKLCFECHDGSKEGKHVNEDISFFDCLDCHNQHGGRNKKFLKANRVDTLCFKCHDAEPMKKNSVHKPMVSGNCSLCHGFHSSNRTSLLITSREVLCKKCHADKDFSDKKRYMHDCLKKGCDVCHDPHSSDFQYQLIVAPGKICVTCHEDFIKKTTECKFKHPILEQTNLCLNCHDPHGSLFKNNLKVVPYNLCLDCHKQLAKKTGRKEYDVFVHIDRKPFKHGPVAEGNCTDCHNQHGSDFYRTLKLAYPETFYSSFKKQKYALCFKCHNQSLVMEKITDTTTNFRDKRRNLHYIHVNKKKGRTCLVCHEVHASESPKFIRKSVSFGNWDIPIEFEKNANGGSCAPGCHKAYKYTRSKRDGAN